MADYSNLIYPTTNTAGRNAIVSPPAGYTVYNTDTSEFEYWNGTAWTAIGSNPTTISNLQTQITSLQTQLNNLPTLANAEQTCDTIAALRAISGASGKQVVVRGYYSAGDGGGGTFYWNTTSTATDDGGITINPTGNITGRWIRIVADAIYAKWYGAGLGQADDSTALIAAWAALPLTGGVLDIANGTYTVQNTVYFDSNAGLRLINAVIIRGAGTITAASGTNFSGKAVVHFRGVTDIWCDRLNVSASNTQSANSPSVGVAVTRDVNNNACNISGRLNISGAFASAAYYNVSAERCSIIDSVIINAGTGLAIYDGSANAAGLSLSPVASGQSNTRKSFYRCNIQNTNGTTQSLVSLNGLEYEFRSCRFYDDNGFIFNIPASATVDGLIIDGCEADWNTGASGANILANRFLVTTTGVTLNHVRLDNNVSLIGMATFVELVGTTTAAQWWMRGINMGAISADAVRLTTAAVLSSAFLDVDRYTVNVQTGCTLNATSRITGQLTQPIIGSGSWGRDSVQANVANSRNHVKIVGGAPGSGAVAIVAEADTGGDTNIDLQLTSVGTGVVSLTNPTTQTTVGAAGTASGLPTAPTGYLQVKISGTVYVVPYYTV